MADVLLLRIQVVQYHCRVTLVAGGEHDDFAYSRKLLQKLSGVGSDVDPRVDLFARGEPNIELNIVGQAQGFVAVDQSLVQVQNYSVSN